MADHTNQPLSLFTLPNHLLPTILAYHDLPSLFRLSWTCPFWRATLHNDDELWHELLNYYNDDALWRELL